MIDKLDEAIEQDLIAGLVLAAGKGTRMKSQIPKVLQPIAGKPMLEHVLRSLKKVGLSSLGAVLNKSIHPFESYLSKNKWLRVCLQKIENGTGGAVASAACLFKGVEPISYAPSSLHVGPPWEKAKYLLLCAGDTPGISSELLRQFMRSSLESGAPLGILGMKVPNPTGYGRLILSSQGQLDKIVEEKDASEAQKKVSLCNSGVLFGERAFIFELLKGITNKNAQGEYYLTDCAEAASSKGKPVFVFETDRWQELRGVNTPQELVNMKLFLEKSYETTPFKPGEV